MDFVLASNNKNKLKEFKEVFAPFNVNIYSLNDLNLISDPEETGLTFKDNAYIKAHALSLLTDKIVVADDSGLEIESLNGFPGVHSSRFMEGHPYTEKFVEINKMLEGKSNRKANFNCTLCVMNLEKEPLYFEGKVFGSILEGPRGENGFGYDPIFFYPPFNTSLADVSPERKNEVSHRGNAIKEFLNYLKEKNYL